MDENRRWRWGAPEGERQHCAAKFHPPATDRQAGAAGARQAGKQVGRQTRAMDEMLTRRETIDYSRQDRSHQVEREMVSLYRRASCDDDDEDDVASPRRAHRDTRNGIYFRHQDPRARACKEESRGRKAVVVGVTEINVLRPERNLRRSARAARRGVRYRARNVEEDKMHFCIRDVSLRKYEVSPRYKCNTRGNNPG